jgi:hypothetical protein
MTATRTSNLEQRNIGILNLQSDRYDTFYYYTRELRHDDEPEVMAHVCVHYSGRSITVCLRMVERQGGHGHANHFDHRDPRGVSECYLNIGFLGFMAFIKEFDPYVEELAVVLEEETCQARRGDAAKILHEVLERIRSLDSTGVEVMTQ